MLGDDVLTFNGKITYYNTLHFAVPVLCNYQLMHRHEHRIIHRCFFTLPVDLTMRSHGSFTLQQAGKLLVCEQSASHGTSSAEGRIAITVTRQTRGTRARDQCLPNKPVVETV